MALGSSPTSPGTTASRGQAAPNQANEINPSAIEAMSEVGIDITGEFPKPWTSEIVQAADIVVTMGCGDGR
jgi:arsenate reductase (thioredoxin)